MTNKKIFADELISDNELELVAGGVDFEIEALADALGIKYEQHNGGGIKPSDFERCSKLITDKLWNEFGIEMEGSFAEKNIYRLVVNENALGGESHIIQSHQDVMRRVREKYPFKA